MKNFWSVFISVSVWAVIICLCLVFLRNCNRPQFYTVSMAEESLVKEVSTHRGVVDWSQLQVDSMNVIHLAANIDSAAFLALRDSIFREEMKAGHLLTADQMSEKITGYYDKLIDVLIALFVLFTVISYFAIRNLSKKEVRDEAREIIKDSSKFKDDVLEALRGEFDGAYLSHDDYDELLKTMHEDIASLKNNNEGQDDEIVELKKETVYPKSSSRNSRKKKSEIKVAIEEAPATEVNNKHKA